MGKDGLESNLIYEQLICDKTCTHHPGIATSKRIVLQVEGAYEAQGDDAVGWHGGFEGGIGGVGIQRLEDSQGLSPAAPSVAISGLPEASANCT